MPYLIGNPLYHWTHLELKRFFGCGLILGPDTVDEIWELTSAMLEDPSMSVRNLIRKSRVKVICTTDDPIDPLEWHKMLAEDDTFDTQVLPAFRPDKCFNINKPGLEAYYEKLSKASGVHIKNIDTLKEALVSRIDFFDKMGCRTADHGLDEFPMYVKPTNTPPTVLSKPRSTPTARKLLPRCCACSNAKCSHSLRVSMQSADG